MLIIRRYLHPRAAMPRTVAALAASMLLVGCGMGGGGGATTPTSSASAPVTPVIGHGGVGAGATGSAAAGTVGHGSTGSFSSSNTGSFSHTSQSVGGSSSVGRVGSASQGSVLSPAQQAHRQASSSQQTTPSATPPPVTHTTPHTTPTRSRPVSRPKPTVRTVTRIRYLTRYRTVYRNRTVSKTVIKTKNPDVPSGAFLPSTHPELAQQSFTITGANVGCQIGAGSVRCGIMRRAWAAPTLPISCHSSWGDTIALPGTGLPKFVCGGTSPVNPAAKVIPPGWDDRIGSFICQVRSFGVNCFDSRSRSGFMISRTGYTLY